MRKVNILSYTLFLLLFLISGCEKITDDTLPPVNSDPTETTDSQKIFFTLQDNRLAIELKQLVTSFGFKSLKIKELPDYGKVTFLPEGILMYMPNENIVEADEQLNIAFEKNDGTIIEEKIVIKIVTENFKFPCVNIAISDKTKTELNTAVMIDVLKNDLICEGDLQGIANIVTAPKGGTAIIENKKIKYIPKNGFKGEDFFIYSINIDNNGKIETRFAFVVVDVLSPNSCTSVLRNDIVNLKPQFSKDTLIIRVLANDKLCTQEFPLGTVMNIEIITKPHYGKATVFQNKHIAYKLNFPPPSPTGQPLLDSMVYKLTSSISSVAYMATVYIKEEKPNNNCRPISEQDKFTFKLKDFVGKDWVEVDVLENDFFCPNIKFANLKMLSSFPKNANLTVTSDNKIRYTPVDKKFNKDTISFFYEITDDKGAKSSTSVTIKFVD